MKKRVLSFVLAVVMLIGLLPSFALFQASAAEVGDTHTVTYGTLNTKKSVSLPITVHNYPNDGMLFEYSSYVSSEDYNYAHAHAEKVTPGYGESWYIYTGHTEMVAGTSMTYLGTYYIASKKDKNYLLCHDTTSDNGVKLFSHWSASIPEGNRRWKAYRDSSGNFQFVNIGSGKALDKNGNQTNLHGWTPNAGANQQWKFVANGDGSYKIFSVANSGLIVDLANGTVADGNTISLYGEDNGTPAQSWYLVPVSGCEADLSGLAGNAMHVTRTASDEASGIGAYATVLEQGMIKENARYLTLVYNVSNETANQFGDEAAQPFKLVPVSGEHGYAVDVSGGTASDGQKIQLWSSPDNNTNTTKYVLPEAAGDGSYYLRWYKCDAYSNFSATDFYIGGVTGNNQDVSCKKRESANRFHILQNADGSYLLRFADADYYGEPIYLSVSENKMANGTRVSSWVWTGNNDEKYYFSKLNGTRITYGTENYRVYPGFDGQSTAYADVQANGVNAALTAAPGYHTVTIDLASSAGFAAAQMISSLSASTPSGKRATLSLAAAGLFSTQSEAEQFGKAALCGLSDAMSYGGYTASFQWVGTTKGDYDVRATVGDRVRRYRMGNNLAFGMLLPNSGYGGANYQAFNNFGYAWGNASDTTVSTNLANGKWLPYEVYEVPYTISGSNDGRWFVNGSSTYNENYPTAMVNGTNYTDVSKFLPNMHSYIEGMATIGLVNYEIDPETKALTYTQQTVQKLAELLKQSLAIPEKNGDDYNYNFVQGAKLSGNKDWAQLIREYLATCPNPAPTSTTESNWASYTQSHKSLLDLSWSEVTDGSHKSNFNNYLDVAYWMLNTLYKDNNGISQTVPEYTHLTLSQETNSAGKTYYVFDGGYDGVTYNANDGDISHVNGISSKDMVYYTTVSDTTLHPFLPTTGSTTFRQTNTPYFLDSGASERSAASFESQIGRDYNFSMEGHGQFVFNAEDNLYFTFEGDDDVYLFINNKMVMDIGAAHSITKSTFNLNDYIKECGLKDGEMYDFDFYYMERHSYGSNIRIETNIDVTSKYIDTVKGATQNGTVVENGGLVDKTKELDYYITLFNTGYELPLKNVAFTDEQVSFAAGYDGVSLGSYTLNGTTYNRKIEDIKIVLTKADGSEINLTFASTGALQTFLTNVTCAGHETPGLQVGERLTLYGIKYGLTRDGTFRNTAYAEASALRTSSTFSVYAGAAQQYFMWAGHPIAVSASDAASVATNSSKVTSFIPSSANGTTVSLRPLADGVYSIGISQSRNFSWSPKGKSGELQSWNANNLYEDSTEGNEPLFYVKYAGNGYYTIYNLQYEQYVSIDAASGTNAASTGAVDVDDRLKLVSLTEAEAQANNTTLWLIERNNGISPNSDQNAYTIRPKLAPKYGVDLDAGSLTNGVKLHLWDVASSTNCGWYFNAHANGDGNMTGFEDDILIFEEQTPGTYTHYFKATYSNGDEVNVPVVLHVLDVKDDTYVLDYGLPVNLNNANDGGLTLNDPIRPTGIEINTLIEGLVSGEAYNGLKQLSKDGKLTTKTNGVSGNTTDQHISTYGTFTADNGDASAHSSRNVSNIELSTSADTGWSDTKPSSGTYETRTVYRYRDLKSSTSTQNGTQDYVQSFPSGFQTSNSLYTKYHKSPVTGSNITTNSTSTVGYIYWHWCQGADLGNPYWRSMGSYNGQVVLGATVSVFHAWESTQRASSFSGGGSIASSSWMDMSLNPVAFTDSGGQYGSGGPYANSASKAYCKDTACWYSIPILRQSYTKTTTTSSWGEWSGWSTSIATASSTRQVETKTQYRSTSSGGSGSDTPVDLDFSGRKAYRIALASDPSWVLSINDASSADWSDSIPTGYSESQCETRTMYRYQDQVITSRTETGSARYVNFPSYFDKSNSLYAKYNGKRRSDVTTTGESTVGYVYWHYCTGFNDGPLIRFIGYYKGQYPSGALGPMNTFHAWESSRNYNQWQAGKLDLGSGNNDAYMSGSSGLTAVVLWDSGYEDDYYSYHVHTGNDGASICKDTIRWFIQPIIQQNWSKTVTDTSWGAWSAWSDAPVEATATRKVETKTQYRLKADVTNASGTNIALQARDDFNTAQLWYFENQSDGSVTITNAKTDMTMQLKANAGNGVQLVQKQTADASKDRWTLVKNSNNTIAIHPASNANQSVDLTDGKKQQNQNIQIWSSQATNANQQWILSPIYQSDTYTRVLFTPTRIMSGASTTKAIVRVHRSSEKPSIGLGNVDVHNEVEMYESLTTIPASVVYYEDNFAGIDYNTNTNSKIDNIGGGDGDYQDADQTGQYGHDSSYEGEGTETSGGSVTKITVLNDEQVASFKFRGTGFEIISRCSAQRSATIIARVYDVSGNQIRNIPVITEYDNNGDDQGSETVYQAPVISVNDLPAGDYTVRIFVNVRANLEGWKVTYDSYDATTGDVKYTMTDAKGNTYTKYYNITTGKSRFVDANGKACNNPMLEESFLYIDGVRIFNPIEGVKDNNGNALDDAYLDNEQGADILQIHDQIEAGKMTATEVNAEEVKLGTGFSSFSENRNNNFIHGNKVDSIEAYSTIGPNNELYLDGLSLTQALGFYVKPDDSVPMTERTLQIGVRALDANALHGYTTVVYESVPIDLLQSNDNGGSPAWTKLASVTSGTEQYYVIDPTLCTYDAGKGAYLVMLRPQNGMVSLTGLKVKGYTLLPIFDQTRVSYDADGKLTDDSIDVVNGMLEQFVPVTTSNVVVEARSASNGTTAIVIGQGDPADETPSGSIDTELPIDPVEPTPDPVDPKPDDPKPDDPSQPDAPEKEPAFADIAGQWYESYVELVAEAGIIKGYDDGLFHGDNHVTREEFAAMLVRALGLTDNGKACAFTDISGRWSEEAIRIAAQNGLVNGVDATTFAPDAEITRQEMMTMIARALKATGLNVTGSDDLSGYADANEVSGWALSSVRTLVASGIISGDNGKLNPTGTCTRSEAAAVFSRLLALLK